MTHLVFLPNDGAVIVHETDESAESLAARVAAGQWQPPSPYRIPLYQGADSLRALTWDRLVVILPLDRRPAPGSAERGAQSGLNARDLQILQYAAEGLSNKEIASLLDLSIRSVARHMEKIRTRLGVETRLQSVGRATQLGLVRMKKR